MIEKILYAAKEAGEIIRDGFGKNVAFEYKTNKSDIVTEIDKKPKPQLSNLSRKIFLRITYSPKKAVARTILPNILG